MTFEKDTAPLERAAPPAGGFFNKRRIGLLLAGVAAVGALSAWGFSIRGEEVEEIKVSDVQPAVINVAAARPYDVKPQTEDPPPQDDSTAAADDTKTDAAAVRRGPPDGFKKTSPVVMRGNRTTQQQAQPVAQQMAQGYGRSRHPGEEGYSDGYDDYGASGQADRRSTKESFYASGGGAGASDLDVAGEFLPELEGCVVKAGEQITLQTRSKVRTTLPQNVLGYVVNPVYGNHYLRNGDVERCLAIRPGSTVLSKINASGVERGDLRIQACALRLDLLGGGRRPLGCQPAHGADGGAGIEASSDYEITGIMTGIVIEAALASARGLGGLIAGPTGVAVQVGGGMISDVGSEYVRRELMRPPVLTMESGAIYGVALNGDLAFPID